MEPQQIPTSRHPATVTLLYQRCTGRGMKILTLVFVFSSSTKNSGIIIRALTEKSRGTQQPKPDRIAYSQRKPDLRIQRGKCPRGITAFLKAEIL